MVRRENYHSAQDSVRAQLCELEELRAEKKKNLLEEGYEYFDSA